MKLITVDIRKPIYHDTVYINSNTIDRAIRDGAKLEIKIPSGSKIVDPVEWKKNGKVMSKVFKYPDRPMILYGNSLGINNNVNNNQPKLL